MRAPLALLALLWATALPAQDSAVPPELPRSLDASHIGGHAATRARGVVSANVAAGSGNVQANVRAIALGDATAVATGAQRVDAALADTGRDARAVMGDQALASPQGLVGINQAAGSANAQLNLLAIGPAGGVGLLQQVDNLALAGTSAEVPLASEAAVPAVPALREARIEGGALHAPTGVLQINQTAGAGNASVNAIVLQLPGSTP